jgi:hypothetical protein
MFTLCVCPLWALCHTFVQESLYQHILNTQMETEGAYG